MKRVDNRRIRQRVSCEGYEIVSEHKGMLEMDNFWLIGGKELMKVFGVRRLITQRPIKRVEIREICVKEVLISILVYRSKWCPFVRRRYGYR